MSGFSADWLALREPFDHAARSNPDLVQWLLPALPMDRPVRILDLACGTGSNLRCLARQLGCPQHWTLVDHDPRLLDEAHRKLGEWTLLTEQSGMEYECRQVDLVCDLDALDFVKFDLVTTSALLDLVSGGWLARLVGKCRDACSAVLFALSYNGYMKLEPGWPGDDRIRDGFNRHQHGDKGFGSALGPDAVPRTRELLAAAGFQIETAATPWTIGRQHRQLQTELIDGFARAAKEAEPTAQEAIAAWRQQRLAYISTGHSRLVVGHEDIAGRLPPD
jgi:SAM-dependent methyltransferase